MKSPGTRQPIATTPSCTLLSRWLSCFGASSASITICTANATAQPSVSASPRPRASVASFNRKTPTRASAMPATVVGVGGRRSTTADSTGTAGSSK
jgi:hypothetical protein